MDTISVEGTRKITILESAVQIEVIFIENQIIMEIFTPDAQKVVYNVITGEELLKVSSAANITYLHTEGKHFIKVTQNGLQQIYDISGNLLCCEEDAEVSIETLETGPVIAIKRSGKPKEIRHIDTYSCL